MPIYAQNTEVPIDRSRAEIERILQRYGATAFMYGWQSKMAMISFEVANRRYRVLLPLPDQNDSQFWRTPARGTKRTKEAAMDAWEQACRQRWRALALWIKAVLEAAETGITTVEQALQTFLVLPDGHTVGEWLQPQIESSYQTGRMPPMLPGLLPSSGNENHSEVIN
jgi:hypothetical protein